MEAIKIPQSVQYILNQLNKNNFEAYIVGGCVRDSIMKIVPHDWDICTSALPEQVVKVFENHQIIPTGLKHGTVTVIVDEIPFEITTYRIDGEYEDNRHPKNVVYTQNVEKDLLRRDFTINALAYNPNEGIIDIVNGIEDINNKIIKCVGNAGERFREDALRILRAIRFATRYNFDIHYSTIFSILANKKLLKNISKERIYSEMIKTLSNDYVSAKNFYLLGICIKEIVEELKNVDFRSLSHKIEKYQSDIYVRLALLFDFDEETLLTTLKQLKYDNDTIRAVCGISKYGKYICEEYNNIDSKYLARLLIKELGNKMALLSVDFAAILHEEEYNKIIKLKDCILIEVENNACCNISQMHINGNDLIKLGFQGIEIGICLNTLLEEIMQDKLRNEKGSLLNRAKELVNI